MLSVRSKACAAGRPVVDLVELRSLTRRRGIPDASVKAGLNITLVGSTQPWMWRPRAPVSDDRWYRAWLPSRQGDSAG